MKVGIVRALVGSSILRMHCGVETLNGVSLLITGDERSCMPATIESEARGCAATLVPSAAGRCGALKNCTGQPFNASNKHSNLNETGTSCKLPTLGHPRYAILRP